MTKMEPKINLGSDKILDLKPRRIRKNRYIPGLAASTFKPTEDWTVDEAKRRYDDSRFPFNVDRFSYNDCVEGMKNIPDESVDLVIADPPFGLSFNGKESIYNRDHRFVKDGYKEIDGDYEEFSIRWIRELPRIMKSTSSAWIFSGWTNLDSVLLAVKKSGLKLVNHVIWKYQFGVFTSRKFVTSHYHVLFLVKSKNYYFNKVTHYPLDVWEINRRYRKGVEKNGTKLPEELIMRCIDFTSRPGDLVLDPFLGNGTTAVAAKGAFRHFYGFEINKNMKELIETNLKSIKTGEFYTPYSDRSNESFIKAKPRHQVSTV